jgi:molybdopterin converting factor small subunit
MEKKDVKIMPPQPTWFFEGADGKPFAVNEREAFSLLTNKSEWRRRDIKMLGASDGTTYHEVVKSAGPRKEELKEEIKKVKDVLNKYIAGHDRLMFDEFAEEDDPRVQRAKKLIAETEEKLEPLENELKELRENLIKRAFNAELEKARGNMQRPKDFTSTVKGDKRFEGMMDEFKRTRRVI